MRVLAFDPGHTTGFALIENGFILVVGAVHFSCNVFIDLIELFQPNAVVIEDVPLRSIDVTTYVVFSLLKNHRPTWTKESVKLFIVKPGVWKPLRQAKNKDFIPHVQDAIGLAQYAERISKDA